MKPYLFLLLILIACVLGKLYNLGQFGPFPKCGPENPQTREDCDEYTMLSGLACCLVEKSNNEKSCALIGYGAAGYLTNMTDVIDFKNLSFPVNITNRKPDEEANYTNYLKENFSEEPTGRMRCLSAATYLTGTYFLLYLVGIIDF